VLVTVITQTVVIFTQLGLSKARSQFLSKYDLSKKGHTAWMTD